MAFELTYRRFSERSILIEWPSIIDNSILEDVLVFKNKIQHSDIKLIVQINHAYNSILIIYEYTIDNIYDEYIALKTLYSKRESKIKPALRHWKIPVCYDDEFGLDLDVISEENKLLKPEIIKLHSGTNYTVFFIGFLPGFLYLGGLDERLHFPRKMSPRQFVKKGAVAIGGEQTGVYPNESPGGWNIIGNSPLEFFNPKLERPCFAKSGDTIQFVSVSKTEYDKILFEVQNGQYHIESEVIDG
ncbi:inhibitor of KinA [Formosa sp. Hel1_31_208]|uniref:5-oxoprolinase subunit PxpB n=1 Tax=Formosa sp. Hel1_31_208 TaxID=1798225 RepID=UPI00087DA69A|nr:5-oxoprolinase subunit PxpB [Formosa sp. Hel1_31_208]SDS49356.1 inhibitor of KinA [Formosa sp. Hel1_31_208]